MEPILRTTIDDSWVFILLLSIMILLGTSRLLFGNFYSTITDLTLFRENNDKFVPFIVLSNVILACLLGIMFYPFLHVNFEFAQNENLYNGLIIIGIILGYIFFRFLVNLIISYLLGIKVVYNDILKAKLFYRLYAIFGLLVTCLFLYYSHFDTKYILYTGVAIIVTTWLLEYIFQFRLNALKGLYTSYYFILYLCTLEILPVLYVLNHWNS